MTSKILILGATGGIGYAVTQNLINRGIPVAILVRNREKALRLFDHSSLLTIHEGDVQDVGLLNTISYDKDFIFHGVNYPYTDWFGNIDTATEKIIHAASLNNARIVYPGSVYNFGIARIPIDETTIPRPNSRKGALRVRMEEIMESAVLDGKCKVLIVRLPDFWGPNVVNHGTVPIFENALKKKPMHYIGRKDVRHQFVYTKDAADIITTLMLTAEKLQTFEVINYGGETFETASDFLYKIAQCANSPKEVRVLNRFVITTLALFMPAMREVKEMLYLFENAIILDDSKVKEWFPHFTPTPLNTAINETLQWFAQYRLNK
ncbi:MAG: NAD-dependent epimerase/dehydratase family protein [Sporocytophaga sp.]|uniref:NAD-dependent epimerase/dehydratase family protein n=1 Tax=Sporocytophaga sp. TaxID=2231183 RepID=UPI001B22B2D0|nr:NAD-dependent epimerase/dehydratase family protein [Sporocytophaga sp.]MBO9703500.1 NAD-dependent epimerase/dehydratase family protein [Sporocytophaga sp.]